MTFLCPGDSHWILQHPQQTKQNTDDLSVGARCWAIPQVAIPLPYVPINGWFYYNNEASFAIQELECRQAFGMEQDIRVFILFSWIPNTTLAEWANWWVLELRSSRSWGWEVGRRERGGTYTGRLWRAARQYSHQTLTSVTAAITALCLRPPFLSLQGFPRRLCLLQSSPLTKRRCSLLSSHLN